MERDIAVEFFKMSFFNLVLSLYRGGASGGSSAERIKPVPVPTWQDTTRE